MSQMLYHVVFPARSTLPNPVFNVNIQKPTKGYKFSLLSPCGIYLSAFVYLV